MSVRSHAGDGVVHKLRGDLYAAYAAEGESTNRSHLSARNHLQRRRYLLHPLAGMGWRQVRAARAVDKNGLTPS